MSTSTNSTENTSNNPVVSVTNNSGVDVDIFDVFDPNPEGQQGTYQYTLLAKVGNGQTAKIQTLRNASELLAGYSGDMTLGGNSAYYEKFPVSSKEVSVLDTPPLCLGHLGRRLRRVAAGFPVHQVHIGQPHLQHCQGIHHCPTAK